MVSFSHLTTHDPSLLSSQMQELPHIIPAPFFCIITAVTEKRTKFWGQRPSCVEFWHKILTNILERLLHLCQWCQARFRQGIGQISHFGLVVLLRSKDKFNGFLDHMLDFLLFKLKLKWRWILVIKLKINYVLVLYVNTMHCTMYWMCLTQCKVIPSSVIVSNAWELTSGSAIM